MPDDFAVAFHGSCIVHGPYLCKYNSVRGQKGGDFVIFLGLLCHALHVADALSTMCASASAFLDLADALPLFKGALDSALCKSHADANVHVSNVSETQSQATLF